MLTPLPCSAAVRTVITTAVTASLAGLEPGSFAVGSQLSLPYLTNDLYRLLHVSGVTGMGSCKQAS